jgi:chemotaxis-related protein WspB
MLLLLFRVAGNGYAVEARRVIEVVPRVDLRPVPHAPLYLAGLFHYRGSIVPVVDIGLLMGSEACRARLDTRIIVTDYPARDGSGAMLGLLAEHVNELKNVNPGSETFPAMHLAEAPYLGPIVKADDTLVQMIALEQVLPESLREGLFGALAEKS